MNYMLLRFNESTAAQLQFALKDRQEWLDWIARGLVTPEHAEGYIKAADNIIRTKRYISEIAG